MDELRATTDELRPATGAHRPGATRMTGRLGSAGRGPGWLAAILIGFVALAIVKPWGPADPAGRAPDTGTRPARPTDAPAPVDPLAALRAHCQEPLGWRVYSRERWADGTFRSWRSMVPLATANGPLDPRIPVAPLGRVVEAVGYCSPWRTAERPPDGLVVTAWRIEPVAADGRALVEAVGLIPFRSFPASPLGALFAAPARSPDPTAATLPPDGPGGPRSSGRAAGPAGSAPDATVAPAWAAGRYVFALRDGAWERWWAVEIEEREGA